MSSETCLDQLLSRWQDYYARGEVLSAAELCRDAPELMGEVERRLHALRQMQQLAETAGGIAADHATVRFRTSLRAARRKPAGAGARVPAGLRRAARRQSTHVKLLSIFTVACLGH